MISKPIGLLWDSVSNNIGDQAIGLVMHRFFNSRNIPFQTVNPFSYASQDYKAIVIGGGELLRRKGDPFYDRYRIPGPHILNTVGTYQPDHLDYLQEYRLVSVRSLADKRLLEPYIENVKISPCATMIMRDLWEYPTNPLSSQVVEPGETIGVHINLAMGQQLLELIPLLRTLSKKYKVVLFPFTLYQNDASLMDALKSWLPEVTVSSLSDPVDILCAIGNMRCMITSSLHASIFAYSQNIPVLAYPCFPKIKYFFEERGLGDYLFSNSEELTIKLDHMLSAPPDWSEKISYDKKSVYEHLNDVIQIANEAGDTKLTVRKSSPSELETRLADSAKNYHQLTMQHLNVWSQLYAENLKLKAHIETIDGQLKAQSQVNKALNEQLDKSNLNNQAINELPKEKELTVQSLHVQLTHILSSTAWSVAIFLSAIRAAIAPDSSRRERFGRKILHSVGKWRSKFIKYFKKNE